MKFVPVDVGSWIQGAGDGKEARWTEQLVNLLRQIAVAVENEFTPPGPLPPLANVAAFKGSWTLAASAVTL